MTIATEKTFSSSINATDIIITVLLAGLVGTALWEVFARAITPLVIGGPLEPVGLIKSVINKTFGIAQFSTASAQQLHYFTGIIGYPLGYLLIARPMAKTLTPFLPWWVVSALYGVALWVFALYIMAHFFAGFPAFLGFGTLSWMSLAGHVLMAIGFGAIIRERLGE